MKAVRIHRFGGPEVLSLDDVPVPEPGDDEILIKVRATSVNPIDYKVRSGAFGGANAQFPIALGRDVAGDVERCGPAVRGFAEGQPVYALLGRGRGGHAEYAVASAGEAAPKPERIDYAAAAAVPLAALTAWQGLFDQGGLKSGQRVLIHGGAGGVGHFAIQLAKARGAVVATTVSGQDLDFARELGADEVVDYRSERFEDAVEPVDMVFDLVGGETQDRSWKVLKQGGIIVSTLRQPPEEKARERHARGAVYMAKPDAGELAEIARLIDAGAVRPFVQGTYPLDQVAAAEEHLEKKHVRGKLVLVLAA